MKNLVSLLIAIASLAAVAHAHAGPFLLINGTAVATYTIGRPSNPAFPVPEDVVIETYQAGQELTMFVNPIFLGMAQQDVGSTIYHWKMGDGVTLDGREITHTYKEPGSYLIDIGATIPRLNQPGQNLTIVQDLTTVQVNIVADEDDEPPLARFTTGDHEITRGQTVVFDASQSEGQTVQFDWDFGDGQNGTGQKISHTYKNPPRYFTVVLRTTDQHGFHAYEAQGFFTKNPLPTPWIIGGVSLLLVGGLVLLAKKTSRVA